MIKFVRYTAPWCAPCRMLAPIISQIEQETPDVVFQTVNVDQEPEQVELYGIRSVPTVIIFKDDAPVQTITGAHPKKIYVEAIQGVL